MLSAESAVGAVPGRGRRDDEPHRRGGRERRRSTAPSSPRSAPSPRRPAPTPSRRPRATSPRRWISRPSCAWTSSGSTALRIARERPQPPILALTPNTRHGAPARARLGRSRRRDRRTPATSTTWRPRLPAGLRGGLRQGRPAHHHRRRRALRHAGRDEHGAHRLHQCRAPGVSTAAVIASAAKQPRSLAVASRPPHAQLLGRRVAALLAMTGGQMSRPSVSGARLSTADFTSSRKGLIASALLKAW